MNWEKKNLENDVTLAVLNAQIKIRIALEWPRRVLRKKLLIRLLRDGACARITETDSGEVQLELLDNVRHTYSGRYLLAKKPIAGPQGFYAMRLVSDSFTDETPSTGHPAERSDVQDQTGQEIKKLRRSITLLWICVLILSIDNRILSCRIDQILSSLELFAKSIENLVHVLH